MTKNEAFDIWPISNPANIWLDDTSMSAMLELLIHLICSFLFTLIANENLFSDDLFLLPSRSIQYKGARKHTYSIYMNVSVVIWMRNSRTSTHHYASNYHWIIFLSVHMQWRLYKTFAHLYGMRSRNRIHFFHRLLTAITAATGRNRDFDRNPSQMCVWSRAQ